MSGRDDPLTPTEQKLAIEHISGQLRAIGWLLIVAVALLACLAFQGLLR